MIYLDHAATTPIHPKVLSAMLEWYRPENVGNPSSIHTQGIRARKAVETARAQVAAMIGAKPSEIYFTSGGTESNNVLPLLARHGVILTDRAEHSSVLDLGSDGLVDWRLPVDSAGRVDVSHLEQQLRLRAGEISVVSVMWVNNELGTMNPVAKIGALCDRYKVLFHTDAVQAAGHVPIDVESCKIDLLSISAHKFGGPLGVGVLYIRDGIYLRPWMDGGGQENGLRGGTENVPGIVGVGVAAQLVTENLASWIRRWAQLRGVFLRCLNERMPNEYQINGDGSGAQNIISLTIPGVESESILFLLDKDGIYCSAGSACSASDHKPSHVLTAIGLSPALAAQTLRISMGVNTTESDVIQAANTIAAAAHRIKAMYPEG